MTCIVAMCYVQGAPSSNSWRPSVDCGIYMTGRVDSAEVQAQVLCVFDLEVLAKFLCQGLMVLFDSGWPSTPFHSHSTGSTPFPLPFHSHSTPIPPLKYVQKYLGHP